MNISFWVVETDFLASTNHFLYIFAETPAGESFFICLVQTFIEQILHSGKGKLQ